MKKVGDAICYLLLLYGMVVDKKKEVYKPINYGVYKCDKCDNFYVGIHNSHDCDK